MSTTLFSSDLLSRLRRTVLTAGILVFSVTAAACGDDDNDDISGPTADCIDDINFSEWFFEEGDLETLRLGSRESGSLTTTDVELDFENGVYYYDVFVFAMTSESDLRITVDPASTLDVTFEAYSFNDDEYDYVDLEAAGGTEEMEYEAIAEGCYLLFVSSYDPEETGSYTVEVERI